MAPRILHVFPGFGFGGAQMRLVQIANHCGDRLTHLICALDGNRACAERFDARVPVSFIAPPPASGTLPQRLAAIRVCLRQTAPDALVTSNWGSIEWAMAARLSPGLRHIHTEDGFGPDEADVQLSRRVWTRRLVLRRGTVVLPSERLLAIARTLWCLPQQVPRYIPNGVDLARYAAAPSGAPWPGNGRLALGTIATLRPEKNIARLIDAAAQAAARPDAPPMRLVIVGDGPERPALEQRARQVASVLPVHFTGHRNDGEALLAQFDLFVLSSDTEQMPLSILEAMASGLPIAATDVGDIRSMLPSVQAGWLTPRATAPLAAAILDLAGSPAKRQELGAANRQRAAQAFDQRDMFASYAALYGA